MPSYLGNVLVIGDDCEDRMSLAEALREHRWVVETAGSGRVGLDAAMNGQPDAVVTDLVLSDVASLSVARSLRTFIEHDVVIVGLAGELEVVDERARAAGFDEVFRKPVDIGQLHARLLAGVASGDADLDRRVTREMEKIRR